MNTYACVVDLPCHMPMFAISVPRDCTHGSYFQRCGPQCYHQTVAYTIHSRHCAGGRTSYVGVIPPLAQYLIACALRMMWGHGKTWSAHCPFGSVGPTCVSTVPKDTRLGTKRLRLTVASIVLRSHFVSGLVWQCTLTNELSQLNEVIKAPS
jgi:hypothetical protein